MRSARDRLSHLRPRVLAALVAACIACAGCAHGPGSARAPKYAWPAEADSATIALWRMDEVVGLVIADIGPSGLQGTAGVDTRSDYGRIGRARAFTTSVNSFVLVPYGPALETGAALTVEAWIDPDQIGTYEDTPIAGRWTPEPLQTSWLLTIVGKLGVGPNGPGPGDHLGLLRQGFAAGKVMFAFQPEEAGANRSFFSTRPVDVGRWTHVAATYDGQVVRIYLNGQLDAQYASPGRIRPSEAPVVIGNYFDPRLLTTFSGDLRMGPSVDPTAYYAFSGLIDEVRISNRARLAFPYARHP